MKVDAFRSTRSPEWAELEILLLRANGSGRPPSEILRLGRLYRHAAADLAVVRRSWPADPMRTQLEGLVGKARGIVYGSAREKWSFAQFLSRGYWQLVADLARPIALAGALLVGFALVGFAWATESPDDAIRLLPEGFRWVAAPRSEMGSMAPAEEVAFFPMLFTNNIRVAALSFAGGITGGIATVLLLAYNGVLLGISVGEATGVGNGPWVIGRIAPHGIIEMTSIVVAAGAGLRMGDAVLRPGYLTRSEALARAARPAGEVVLGCALWLVVAGFIEAFISPSEPSLALGLAIGLFVAGIYWMLVFTRGRQSGITKDELLL